MKHKFAILTTACALAVTVDTAFAQPGSSADAVVDEIFQQFGGGHLAQPSAQSGATSHDTPAVVKQPDAGGPAQPSTPAAGPAQGGQGAVKQPDAGRSAQPSTSAASPAQGGQGATKQADVDRSAQPSPSAANPAQEVQGAAKQPDAGRPVQPDAPMAGTGQATQRATKSSDADHSMRSSAPAKHRVQQVQSGGNQPFAFHLVRPGTSADEIVQEADKVLGEFDAGHYDDVWRGMPSFVQAQMQLSVFVQHTQEVRQRLGTVVGRYWAGVSRLEIKNTKGAPDGMYANVDYVAKLTDGSAAYEHLTFRLEDDGHWHLTGYVAKPAEAASSKPSHQ